MTPEIRNVWAVIRGTEEVDEVAHMIYRESETVVVYATQAEAEEHAKMAAAELTRAVNAKPAGRASKYRNPLDPKLRLSHWDDEVGYTAEEVPFAIHVDQYLERHDRTGGVRG